MRRDTHGWRLGGALAVGLLGLVGCGAGLAFDPGGVLRGWLAGFVFWLGFPLGGLMLLLAHDLTGGRWGAAAGPPLRAAVATMPLLALALVPLLVALPLVYPWAQPEESAHLKNLFYLNTPFFIGRAIGFMALWIVLGLLIGRRAPTTSGVFAAPALIVMALTATFASFDWIMSVEPEWGSSIYGMMVIAGQLLAALALATLTVATGGLVPSEPGQRMDLGSLLIAGILLWFYLSFMQFLIIWEENLPNEISWYVPRLAGGWGWAAVFGALGKGAIPFLLLIWWPVKRSRRGLAIACGLLLAAHLMECWWLVLPGTEGGFTWFAPAATLAIGGFWLALYGWRLDALRLVPDHREAPRGAALEGTRHG